MNPEIKPTYTQLFIDGKYVNAKSNKKFPTVNPVTEEVICDVFEAGKQDVDDAVDAAQKAFQPSSVWRKMSSYDRGQILNKIADLIEKNVDELTSLECLDTGKPFMMCKMADMPVVINQFRYMAGWCDKLVGQTISIPGPYFCYTRKEPVGVCAIILPWNFPLMLLSWKVSSALAAGSTVIIKPAEQSPLTALRFGQICVEAGIPNGVVNILTGFGETGAMLVEHPRIDKIAFTGSTEVGQKIMQRCSIHNLKKLQLELGGKSPVIILDDADIDAAVETCAQNSFFNAGQVCINCSRIFVQENIYDTFVNKMVERQKKIKVGCNWQPDTFYCPVIDETQFKKIMGYIQKGQEQGAKLMCGGSRLGNKGYFIQPTVFGNVDDANILAQEEIFGPTMQLLKFKTIDEVIKRANATQYGLASGVFTKSIENYLKIANSIQAGIVWVNTYGVTGSSMSFGGSGFGRENGEEGIKEYLQSKVVVVKQSEDTLGF